MRSYHSLKPLDGDVETDSVYSLQLWGAKLNNLIYVNIHPVVTDEKTGPIVDALMADNNQISNINLATNEKPK